ncbi:MAG: pilus assembly protein, partial [Anaerolineae bacterium]|nr:pilus assembly protein [Anaerolineae bacterium]
MLRQRLKLGFKTSVIAAALAALPIGTNAAGLGRISVQSALGQPLRAEIELTVSREELSMLTARLASFDAYRKAGIEYVPVMAGIKLTVDSRTKKTPVIRMTTDQPVNEPFLDLLIELDWNAGRLVREYTFLLDPAPDVLAHKPVAAPEAKRGGAPVAQPSPV